MNLIKYVLDNQVKCLDEMRIREIIPSGQFFVSIVMKDGEVIDAEKIIIG